MWRFLSFFALLASKVAAFFSLLSSFAAACPRLTGQKWTRPTFKKYGNMIRNGLNPTKGILEHKVDKSITKNSKLFVKNIFFLKIKHTTIENPKTELIVDENKKEITN